VCISNVLVLFVVPGPKMPKRKLLKDRGAAMLVWGKARSRPKSRVSFQIRIGCSGPRPIQKEGDAQEQVSKTSI
jgi:hypothetical protein